MTRCELVKAAMAHEQTEKVPSCIHLAGDGWEKYADRLFDRYVTGDTRKLYDEGKLSRQHAIYYGMGNHVLCVSCPWWDWYDLPRSYYEDEDAPDYLPKQSVPVATVNLLRQCGNSRNIRMLMFWC